MDNRSQLGAKALPKGLWFHINGLPATATDQNLSAWLKSLGVDIPASHIDVKPRRDGDSSATICFPMLTAVQLLNRVIREEKIGGRQMLAEYKPSRIGEWW